jgi:SpoVK/Ycf46/Vps4 family AAA+-type ATPase
MLARDGGPTRPDLEAVLRPSIELTTGGRAYRRVSGSDGGFILEALNANADLERIAERLCKRPRDAGAGMSLCLYGPPGTGKSAYARHLAQRLGIRTVERTVSDLVSPFVGTTEQNIARAFDEAERAGTMLVFDEIDSFLRNRALGRQSWEITEVNEFLRQLENFPGIFVCTTNRFEDLDPAAARRFVFKIRFDWLRPEQAVRLFRDSLGPFVALKRDQTRRAEQCISELSQLAPGDFAAVRRRLTAMGARTTPMELVEELTAELAAKQGPRQAVGFRA